MTADAAAHGIRKHDTRGSIGLISAEPHAPYNRPPLSKGLWKGEAEDSIWRKTAETGAQVHLERVGLDGGTSQARREASCASRTRDVMPSLL